MTGNLKNNGQKVSYGGLPSPFIKPSSGHLAYNSNPIKHGSAKPITKPHTFNTLSFSGPNIPNTEGFLLGQGVIPPKVKLLNLSSKEIIKCVIFT